MLIWSEELLSQHSNLSPSPAHISHTRNITLSRIKWERYIFIKKCVRSFIEVRILLLTMFLHIFVYVYVYAQLYYVYSMQFPVDHFPQPDVSTLILFLCQFAAFANYVIGRFVSITT